jgi:cupin fold WbuC family metalloprotein
MKNFFSATRPLEIIHTIADANCFNSDRLNITSSDRLVQASLINLKQDIEVGPHRHLERTYDKVLANCIQECWLIYKGSVLLRLYDELNVQIHEETLGSGMIIVSYSGSHYLRCLESDTVLLEFKRGPYIGRDYINVIPH